MANKPEQTNEPIEQPDFSHEEMKMPEEHFGGTGVATETKPDKPNLTPFIVVLVLIFAAVLAGLFLWSRTFNLNMLNPIGGDPADTMEEETATSTAGDAATTDANAISALATDLAETNLDALDAELPQIKAELDSELGTTTSAQ